MVSGMRVRLDHSSMFLTSLEKTTSALGFGSPDCMMWTTGAFTKKFGERRRGLRLYIGGEKVDIRENTRSKGTSTYGDYKSLMFSGRQQAAGSMTACGLWAFVVIRMRAAKLSVGSSL